MASDGAGAPRSAHAARVVAGSGGHGCAQGETSTILVRRALPCWVGAATVQRCRRPQRCSCALLLASVWGAAGLGSEEHMVPRDAESERDRTCTTGRSFGVRHRDVSGVDERTPRAECSARRCVFVKPDIEGSTPPVGRRAARRLMSTSRSATNQCGTTIQRRFSVPQCDSAFP